MKKTNIFLEVVKGDEDSLLASEIQVRAWLDAEKDQMVDAHLTEEFPELEELDLYDLMEGEMEYDGSLSIEELKNELRILDFNVI